MTTWLTMIGMAAVTYMTRVTALLVLRSEIRPWLRSWLAFVPIAVFAALVVPSLLLREGHIGGAAALLAGGAGALVAWRSSNVLLTIIAGLLTFWLLRWVGM